MRYVKKRISGVKKRISGVKKRISGVKKRISGVNDMKIKRVAVVATPC
jgi:hypothetical protein